MSDKNHRLSNESKSADVKQPERIDLNNYDRPGENDQALKQHTDQDLGDLDRNLDEQMGASDNTVFSEPNHI